MCKAPRRNKTTTYSGAIAGSPVTKNSTRVQIAGGSPTGQVFNTTTDFALGPENTNPAVFIFGTESGQISGWNPHVDPATSVGKAFDPKRGELLGTLRDPSHRPIVVENLWGLRVGNSNFGGVDSIVFSAAPDDEAHGLIGTLTPAPRMPA